MAEPQQASKATEFIERFKDLKFRRRLAPHLRKIEEGDWDAVVEIARTEGFQFTKAELKDAMPKCFFRGEGRRKERGWSPEALKK